jgi:hypothetical protein
LLATLASAAAGSFRPGELWPDTDGNHIQAHGGGILQRGDTYYWYGEDRTRGGNGAVACYSSTNLYNWKREGVVLSRDALPRVDGQRTFVERPKVIFNPRTGKYVMWMHLEQRGYAFASAGIAVGDSPTGEFKFLKYIRPITQDFGFEENDPNRQKQLGGTFRDMNLFVDDDGRAYVFYASEGNWTMYIVRLDEEFTGPELPVAENKTWARAFVRQMREAPAPFKHNGRYYVVTSGCTGWKPNPAEYAVADNILGPWKTLGDPCVGPEARTTYRSQSTFVLPVPNRPGKFIYMGDRWNDRDLPDSRYVWLPLAVNEDGTVRIDWHDEWDLSIFSR